MRRFKGECAHFIFNKCPIYTRQVTIAKFSANSDETENSEPGMSLTFVYSVPENSLKKYMKGVLLWLVRWARLAGTRDFCPTLADLVGQVQNILFSLYANSLHFSPWTSRYPNLCSVYIHTAHILPWEVFKGPEILNLFWLQDQIPHDGLAPGPRFPYMYW
jgi:hypothetical protein